MTRRSSLFLIFILNFSFSNVHFLITFPPHCTFEHALILEISEPSQLICKG